MKQLTALALLVVLLVSALACTREVERIVVVTPTRPPATATSQPLATPTLAPTPPESQPESQVPPTPLPDRVNCADITGTEYRSPTERQWYLANCVPTLIPPEVPALEPPPPASPLSIEEARSRHSIMVNPGDSASAIISAYGQPSSDEVLSNFDPPVMRQMRYGSLGLRFMLNRDRLCCIDVTQQFQGEVFGLKIGDSLSAAVAIYGDKYHTFDTAVLGVSGSVRAYSWTSQLPNWFFYEQNGVIVAMSLFVRSIYGNWVAETP
jgi:hypothetical protein